MNRKLVIGAVAGVAAVALAYGGSTYSAWSDFADVTGNSVGAGELVLNIGGPNGSEAVQHASYGNFAPGEGSDTTRYLASKQGDAVPTADLSVKVTNISNADNFCSSNSEKAEEPTCQSENTTGGEFGAYAQLTIQASAPTTAGNCGTVAYTTAWQGSINAALNNSVALGQLGDGDGICVKAIIKLPDTAPNATQGDSTTFDWHYDLVQS